jgi:ABC-type lipoprotein export system ATPase subunit
MQITLQNLVPIPLKEKFSSRQSAIWNSDITFSTGEWVKIVAPSGSGKTTLMNILYKVRHDYEGSVKFHDQDLKDITGDELAKLRQQKVSVVFQDLRLFENLTVRENIELNRVLQTPYYPTAVVDEMATRLGIAHIIDQRAGLCSYGEQQRVAVIRALVQPFDWLMMDEPFSHLDIANTKKAAALITEECRKRNAGFVLTDLDEDTLFPYSKSFSL